MSTPKPCLMVRETETRIWGGRSLHGMFGVQGDGDEPIGETWELFDRQDRSSRIQGGGTLRELMEQHDTALLGRGVEPGYDGRFPLLFKFLDAQDALSVQVHPDDEQARPHSDSGKTEAWVVLDATDQARICRGFRPGVTREKFIDAVRAGGHGRSPIEDQLFSFRPKAGDCIYTPAGTVHSMGPGVVVFEVQQNSNITYRLYDWGRDRRMHIEQGL